MIARIYRPCKTAMQSGRGKSKIWCLEYAAQSARTIDPLMGYTSTQDALAQIRLEFNSLQEAEHYAKAHNIEYRVHMPHERTLKRACYPDNFAHSRKSSWTH